MIPVGETFDGTWPYAPHFCDAPGFRMHYVDEGKGEPIVCLHGEPTWGHLYRRFIPPLSQTHRILVADHMGFGKSETPRDRAYTLKTHVENLTSLIEALDLRDITFVAQDWGGPIAAAYTIRYPVPYVKEGFAGIEHLTAKPAMLGNRPSRSRNRARTPDCRLSGPVSIGTDRDSPERRPFSARKMHQRQSSR
jgi:pimeloyl-ACP methyl ester carboxylesterase